MLVKDYVKDMKIRHKNGGRMTKRDAVAMLLKDKRRHSTDEVKAVAGKHYTGVVRDLRSKGVSVVASKDVKNSGSFIYRIVE